ncbi:MAG TPA: hypothetical protein VIV40_29470 [Kofleriaceae bacterium]
MKKFTYAFTLAALLHSVPACVDDSPDDTTGEEEDFDDKSDGALPVVTDDNLNGQWIATVNGVKQTDDDVVESWSSIGIRLHVGTKVYQLSRSGDKLTGTGVSLDVKPNKSGVRDDVLEGTVDGATVKLARDTRVKPSITVTFPADRPYRTWLVDTIMPLSQQDRESYIKMNASSMLSFLTDCELYRHGSWLRQYFKGATWAEQSQSFKNVVYAMDGLTTTPRQITSNYKFSQTLQANLSDPSKMGLAMSTFGMYFTTAAGRSLRMPITSTSSAYFITDKPKRGALLGLVVMDTPTHHPLASTFGRQLLDLGAMPQEDSRTYVRSLMELLAKSDNHTASALSGVGQSALTDWFSVMAIEDYRGMAFGSPNLGWGYNMTNVQFFGLIARALARPGAVDSTNNPVVGQVVVGSELRPGEASYADVLNHGNDMQEYPDMSALKIQATNFLRAKHPQEVAAVEAAFATIVPKSQADWRAQQDIFHYITAQLYDSQGRTANLKGAVADTAITAVVALFDALYNDSAAFEQYLLAHGFTKSNVAAPKSTGF